MFVEILLLTLVGFHAIEAQNSFITLKSLGCWKDNYNKIIPGLEGTSSILNGYYKSRKDAVQKCARTAMNRGLRVFVVQDGGWCGSSSRVLDVYKKLGRSDRCKADGKGGFRLNEVYDIVGTVIETPGRVSSSRPLVIQPEYVFTDGGTVNLNKVFPQRGPNVYSRPRAGQRLVPSLTADSIVENENPKQHLSVHAFILKDFGCWALPTEGIESMEGVLPELDGHYRHRVKAVQKCAKGVGEQGYELFAMHDGGKCLVVNDLYAIEGIGRRRSCSYTGKGSSHAIQVYEIRYSKTRDPPPPFHETPTRPSNVIRPASRLPTHRPPTTRLPPTTTTTRATSPDTLAVVNGDEGEEIFLLSDLGCWNYAWNDSIPSLEATSSILDGHYSQRRNAVKKCAKVAAGFGFDLFALQDGGRCVSSGNARNLYSNLGRSLYCREDGRGGSWVNQVYEVNVIWDVTISGLGCYSTGSTGPIPSLEGSSVQLDGNYFRRYDAIRKCARVSASRSFEVFAVQDDGKCMADAHVRDNYAKYGNSSACAYHGRGGPSANEVYEITSSTKLQLRNLGCWKDKSVKSVPGMEQTDGDLMDSYKTRKDAIGKCARVASRNGFEVFVLSDGGWCGGSKTAGMTYSIYGRSNLCKSDGQGGVLANQVYEIV